MYDKEPSATSETGVSLDRRRFLLTTGSLGIATVLAGCGGQEGPGVGTPTPTNGTTGTETPTETETTTETETQVATRLRVAHLSPDAPNVDVYVDGSVVLEDVAFGSVSDYLDVDEGSHTVEITAAGDAQQSVAEEDVTLSAGTDHTVAAIGELDEDAEESFRTLVLEDQNDPPTGQTARLRGVHASPDAPAVDVSADNTVLFDGLSFGDATYTDVQAGDYTVEVRRDTENNDGEVVATSEISVSGGEVYTVFAAGYLTPEDEPADTPFELIVVQDTDADTGTTTPQN